MTKFKYRDKDGTFKELQDKLVSSENIKTINNQSLLGSGNIDIQSGSSYTAGEGINIENNEISVDNTVIQDNLTSITGYDSTKTQILKNINGTLQWVDE